MENEEKRVMTPLAARLWMTKTSFAWRDVDIIETDKEYFFSFDIPEDQRDNVKIWINGNKFSVSGEKGNVIGRDAVIALKDNNGRYHRDFNLPVAIDSQKVDAHYMEGILVVVLPKAANSNKKNLVPLNINVSQN